MYTYIYISIYIYMYIYICITEAARADKGTAEAPGVVQLRVVRHRVKHPHRCLRVR